MRRLQCLLVCSVVLCMLSACGEKEQRSLVHPPYSAELVSNFVTACTAVGLRSKTFCQCAVREVSKQLPEATYVEQEMQYMKTGKMPEDFAKAIAAAQMTCASAELGETMRTVVKDKAL